MDEAEAAQAAADEAFEKLARAISRAVLLMEQGIPVLQGEIETDAKDGIVTARNVSGIAMPATRRAAIPDGGVFAWDVETRAVRVSGPLVTYEGGEETYDGTEADGSGMRYVYADEGRRLDAHDLITRYSMKKARIEEGEGRGAKEGKQPKTAGPLSVRYSQNTKLAQIVEGTVAAAERATDLYVTREEMRRDPRETGQIISVASVAEERRGKAVRVFSMITTEGMDGGAIQTATELDAMDVTIMNVIGSYGKEFGYPYAVTPNQINDAMDGKPRKLSSARRDAIAESMRKMRIGQVKIDYTEQARSRRIEVNGEPVEELTEEGAIVPNKEQRVKTRNGRYADGFIVFDAPPMFAYAERVNEIVSFPPSLLALESSSSTNASIIARNYIVRRIRVMKNQKGGKSSRTIRYEAVMKAAGVDPSDRHRANRLKDATLRHLEKLAKDGEIKGYREKTEGSRHERAGIEIRL